MVIADSPPQILECTDDDKTQFTSDEDGKQYFSRLAELLDDYYPVHYAHLISNPCWTASIEENALYLARAIDEVTANPDVDKVILIAHSMGGIISRAYIERNGLYQNDVDTLITLGSPHTGVGLDVLDRLIGGWGGLGLAVYCLERGPAACQFSEWGMWVLNRLYATRRPGVKYYTISGDAPWDTRNAGGKILDELMNSEPNDGIIKQSSGLGLPGVIQGFPTDENHNVFGTDEYRWTYLDTRITLGNEEKSKTYTQCIKPILVDKTQTSCHPSAYLNITTEESLLLDEPKQRTPIEYNQLLPAEILTRTLWLEDGPAVFAAGWQTGTVSFILQSPAGILIDEAYAADNPTVVSYTDDSSNVIYQFSSIAAGEWKMILQGSDLPAGGTSVSTFAAVGSPLNLSAGVEKKWIQPGDTGIITATLQGAPLSSGWITATLTYADSSQAKLSLSPQGNGTYQTAFSIPDLPGYTLSASMHRVGSRVASGLAGAQTWVFKSVRTLFLSPVPTRKRLFRVTW